jgi:integrase
MAKAAKFYDEVRLERAVMKAQADGVEARFPVAEQLTCVVTAAGRARFVHRFPFRGRYPVHWFEGTYPDDLSIRQAIALRDRDRGFLAQDMDPLLQDGEVATDPTLAEFARQHFLILAPPQERLLADPEKSPWLRDLTVHVGPLAKRKIDEIGLTETAAALKRYWNGDTARPTGRRLVMRVMHALEHRHITRHPEDRQWQNPVTWRRVKAINGGGIHHADEQGSLPFVDGPAFVAKLRARHLMSARLAEFAIFAGVRLNEARLAKWGEINWTDRTWTIPAARMKTQKNKGKAGRAHIVPLSAGLVRVLNRARKFAEAEGGRTVHGPEDFIFPSFHHFKLQNKPYLHKAALREVQLVQPTVTVEDAFGRREVNLTVHGFRSSLTAFGVSEKHRREPFTAEVMDACLAHAPAVVDDKGRRRTGVIGRYIHNARTDAYFTRRLAVMREWSKFLNGLDTVAPAPAVVTGGNVVHLKRAA